MTSVDKSFNPVTVHSLCRNPASYLPELLSAVVTVASQEAGDTPPSNAVMQQTAHSGLGAETTSYLQTNFDQADNNTTVYSDQNVLELDTVKKLVNCVLISAGSSCVVAPASAAAMPPVHAGAPSATTTAFMMASASSSETKITGSSAVVATPGVASLPQPLKAGGQRLFNAADRVRLTAPRTLLLAQKNDLPLKIVGGNLDTIFVFQKQEKAEDATIKESIPDGDASLPVLRRENGEAYIQLTPLRLGKVIFDLHGTFKDGGMWNQRIALQVEPPAEAPLAFYANRGEVNQMLDETNGFILIPLANYPGLQHSVRIDHHFVSFNVRTAGNRRVIEINPATGQVKPVAVGDALIQTSYAGASTLTCVMVHNKNSVTFEQKSHCRDLLREGERAPYLRRSTAAK